MSNKFTPINAAQQKKLTYESIRHIKEENTALAANAHVDDREALLKQLGIECERQTVQARDKEGKPLFDDNGNPRYVSVLMTKKIPAWYTRAINVMYGKEPCYFEGCQKVVDAFNEDLQKAGGGSCTQCQKNRVFFRHILNYRNALPPEEVNKVAQPTLPPVKVTNLATNEVKIVPRQQIPYATIRREVPDALKTAFTKPATERKLVHEVEIHEPNTVTGAPRVYRLGRPGQQGALPT